MVVSSVTIHQEFHGGRDIPEDKILFLKGDGKTIELDIPEDCEYEVGNTAAFAILKRDTKPLPAYSIADDASVVYMHELYGPEKVRLY